MSLGDYPKMLRDNFAEEARKDINEKFGCFSQKIMQFINANF
jgi:hypothetical protein